MIEALRTLANISDYSDVELASLVETFGRVCSLHQLSAPVMAVIDARKELERLGDSAALAANIIACAEALVDIIDTSPLQGVSDIPHAPGASPALQQAIDNMRAHRSK